MNNSTKVTQEASSGSRLQSTARRLPHVTSRSRWSLLGFAAAVLALGWGARLHASSLPFLVSAYAPDTLWALLVFLVVLLLRPVLPTRRAFLVALLLSYGVEFSQLYQAPWLNQIRDTRFGGLLLGHGFLWSDLLCYTVRIVLGAAVDARLRRMLQGYRRIPAKKKGKLV